MSIKEWETLANEAIDDARYWKAQSHELLAALRDILAWSDAGLDSDYPEPPALKRARALIAEGIQHWRVWK